MFFITNAKYQETKDILLQKNMSPPLVSEFADWFSQEYYANLLNIDFIKSNFHGLDLKYDLLMIVENQTGRIKAELDLEDRIKIKEKFIALSTKYNFANIQNLGDIEQISVCFFQYESQIRLIEKTLGKATGFLTNKYPEIRRLQQWHNTIAVIYHSDAQALENKKGGVDEMIMKDYFDIVKNSDDLNCFVDPLTGLFVSQETLDRSYLGELHYYMR